MTKQEARPAAVVLIVEDEPLLRMHSADFIEAAGYRVLESSNTDDALNIMDAHPEVCVVLTDVELPGSIDGFRLAALIGDRWPSVNVIVISGVATPDPGMMPPGGVFLHKPVEASRVLQIIDAFVAQP